MSRCVAARRSSRDSLRRRETMAASTGCGRFRNSPDAKSATISMQMAAISPDIGVRAPALSLTSDCDMPPLTGNPRPSPATRFAAPIASISRLASNRLVCFWENIRPIADVSTAARRKPASATGTRSFSSLRLTIGSPIDGRPRGTSPSSATPVRRAAAVAPRQCRRRRRETPRGGVSSRACRR